ncbi:MAG: hypothetical protein AAGC68_09620 [Verrucomicrobiota bacterium]
MAIRSIVSAALIVLGISSPWLVKDWMDWKENGGSVEEVEGELRSFADRLRESFKPKLRRGEAKESENHVEVPSDKVESYPLASTTMRVLEGFLPPSLRDGDGGLSLPGTLQIPNSTIAEAAIAERTPRLGSELARLDLQLGDPIFVRLFKEENELEVWLRGEGDEHFTLFRVLRVRDWSGLTGPKLREGDGQAPEGFYYVPASRLRPETRHFLGFDLGYPNDYDRLQGREGSDILIHAGDRSAGSYVLERDDMADLYVLADAALRDGQRYFRVNAFPFRMTDKRMEVEWKRQPRWISFWVNLKEGYDFFENVNYPPNVSIEGEKYAFLLE